MACATEAHDLTARIYPSAFAGLQSGALDWEDLSVKGILLSEGFTYDPSMQYRDEIDDAFVIADSDVMENPERNGNVVNGDPIQWLQLSDNRLASKIVLYNDTGDDAYSELIAFFDTEDVEGLPFVINGQNYYLYPVSPPGGYFSYGDYSEIIGPIASYTLAYALALGESIGGSIYSIPVLVFGLDLTVNERICIRADALDQDECRTPTIRSTRCA